MSARSGWRVNEQSLGIRLHRAVPRTDTPRHVPDPPTPRNAQRAPAPAGISAGRPLPTAARKSVSHENPRDEILDRVCLRNPPPHSAPSPPA
ncbi:hypothetical protein GCM10010384_42060 [Streptomyces djakartensis]|uniref:Uncharacterized protein n=1 Tax=Streptomyces djakartensis TaxID=68193 RepID=A0ABQ2ZZM0_9ACTN|nr:hypothetical protein GCM10010384_42060 [Streptomyces djakartensis]